MSFTLRTPKAVKQTDIQFDPRVLEVGHCGLFRAPLHLAAGLMPEMRELIESAPVPDPASYELDIKVHMLMPGQFPCIPNWHTDMVPRDETGLRFDMIDPWTPAMLLWISDGPETEFLARPMELLDTPGSHQEIARTILSYGAELHSQLVQPNVWWSMDQQTPHRGTMAKRHSWRVFARVTHRSIAPQRPVHSVLRRHAQVYLDAATFGW